MNVTHYPILNSDCFEDWLQANVGDMHPQPVENCRMGFKVVGIFKRHDDIWCAEVEDGNQVGLMESVWITPEHNFRYYTSHKPTADRNLTGPYPAQVMEQPTLGVGAFIARIDKGRTQLLLAMRSKGPSTYIGRWSNPGGAVEIGETTEQALIREILEECSIELTYPMIKNLGLTNEIHQYSSIDKFYHALSVTYLAIVGGTIEFTNHEPEKQLGMRWFDINEIDPMECTPLFREHFHKVKEMLP